MTSDRGNRDTLTRREHGAEADCEELLMTAVSFLQILTTKGSGELLFKALTWETSSGSACVWSALVTARWGLSKGAVRSASPEGPAHWPSPELHWSETVVVREGSVSHPNAPSLSKVH